MVNIVLSLLGTTSVFIWLFIGLTDKKRYQSIIDGIDGSEYFLKELFFVGFRIMGWLKLDVSSPSLETKARKLGELCGKKEAKKLVVYDLAAQITYIVTFIPIGILCTVMLDDMLYIAIVMLLVGFLVIYVEYDKNNKLQKRHEQILREFPHVLSQMSLLVNAGMPLREVLNTTAGKGDGILGQEIKTLSDEMANGIQEYEAFTNFADRCGVDCVRKFSSLIVQNVKKGSSELSSALLELSNEVWRNRVSTVKEEGEKASAKLLVPILIIFIGILIMVAAPMLRNMNF